LTANWSPAAKERALEEWRNRNSAVHHAWYCDRGRACDGKPHEGYDYKHARGDQWPPEGLDWRIWAIFSGRGCVAPWTRIYDPFLDAHVPIADLADFADPHALTMGGPVAYEGPFRKGIAHQWTVTTTDGCQITVTDQHRFLTRAGWQPLIELTHGDVIAGGAPRPPHSTVPVHKTNQLALSQHSSGHNDTYRSNFPRMGGKEFGGDFATPWWVEIDSISYSHRGEFWDLQVPVEHHYSAEGLWHHNSGKTRTGAEWVRKVSEKVPRIGMVGRRGVDVRAVMVEGDSGLITVCENAGISYHWEPTKREFHFENGCTVFGYTGEEPNSLRGPQHGAIWLDEPAHMPLIDAVWEQVLLSTRLKAMPGGSKILVTTTPLPIPFIKKLAVNPKARVVRVSTFANMDNLDDEFRETLLEQFEGTRRGRQELYGEIVEDIEGALWTTEMFRSAEAPADFDRIVVAIDPAGSVNKRSDETGIVAAGKLGNNYYVLQDLTGKYSPNEWASKAMHLYRIWGADAIIAEKQYGGDMVKSTLDHYLEDNHEEARVLVTNAMHSKRTRAEPIVGLYEQERVFHLRGLAELETEMVSWVPGTGASPNRLDAAVWAITELSGKRSSMGAIATPPDASLFRPTFKTGRDLIRGIFA
jgi:phage terminase large subunit-like protein